MPALRLLPEPVLRIALGLVAWVCVALSAVAADANDAGVHVARVGDEFIVEGSFHVLVPLEIAWAVLTDYEGMPAFVDDMSESRIVHRDGMRLRLVQRGVTRLGPLAFDYDVEREVVLEPLRAAHSHVLRGNVKKLDMDSYVDAEGAGTRIRFRAVMVPDFWVPPLVGSRLIRTRFERQFDNLLKEMRRRSP